MKNFYLMIFMVAMLSSCNKSYDKTQLIGKWNYVKVEFLKENPIAVQDEKELKEKNAYIQFNSDNEAFIYSSGKILSKGTFVLENEVIRYEEIFENGTKRKIPFLIKSLDDRILVFETMDKETKRISANKVQ